MAKRFLSQAWLSFKGQQAMFRFDEFITLQMFNPLITLIFYCVLASYSFNTNNLTKWVVGNSFMLCIHTCIFSVGVSFVGERYYGRLRSIIVSPSNKLGIIAQKGLFPNLISIVNVICGFVVGSIIFGVDFASINMGLFAIITAAAMFATTAFGTFLAVFGLITDSMHIILNTVASGLLIFSGSNFPITQLPYMGQIISRALPLTRSIEAANMLFGTIDQNRLSRLLLEEIGIGIIYYIIAFVIIKLVEKIAIKKARLEVF